MTKALLDLISGFCTLNLLNILYAITYVYTDAAGSELRYCNSKIQIKDADNDPLITSGTSLLMHVSAKCSYLNQRTSLMNYEMTDE